MSLRRLSFAPVWFEDDHRWRFFYEEGPLPSVSGIEPRRDSLDDHVIPERSVGPEKSSLSQYDPNPLRQWDPRRLAMFEDTNE